MNGLCSFNCVLIRKYLYIITYFLFYSILIVLIFIYISSHIHIFNEMISYDKFFKN